MSSAQSRSVATSDAIADLGRHGSLFATVGLWKMNHKPFIARNPPATGNHILKTGN